MPLYSFRCTACGKVFEAFLRMSEALAGVPCPECRALARDLSDSAATAQPTACGPPRKS